jgi:hypothetical protein
MSVCAYSVYVVLCVGRGLATGGSPAEVCTLLGLCCCSCLEIAIISIGWAQLNRPQQKVETASSLRNVVF